MSVTVFENKVKFVAKFEVSATVPKHAIPTEEQKAEILKMVEALVTAKIEQNVEAAKARHEILESEVYVLGMSTRTSNTLVARGIRYVKDLVAQRRIDVWVLENIGAVALSEIDAAMRKYNLHFIGE